MNLKNPVLTKVRSGFFVSKPLFKKYDINNYLLNNQYIDVINKKQLTRY